MSRKDDRSDWMWARACQMLDEAERMQSRFFRMASSRSKATWEPPVDVFEDRDEVLIVAAMPGVPADRVEVVTEPGVLVIRGERPLPFAGSRLAVRHLEIPYGYFERRIALPAARFDAGTHELAHGCLVVRLRKSRLEDTP